MDNLAARSAHTRTGVCLKVSGWTLRQPVRKPTVVGSSPTFGSTHSRSTWAPTRFRVVVASCDDDHSDDQALGWSFRARSSSRWNLLVTLVASIGLPPDLVLRSGRARAAATDHYRDGEGANLSLALRCRVSKYPGRPLCSPQSDRPGSLLYLTDRDSGPTDRQGRNRSSRCRTSPAHRWPDRRVRRSQCNPPAAAPARPARVQSCRYRPSLRRWTPHTKGTPAAPGGCCRRCARWRSGH